MTRRLRAGRTGRSHVARAPGRVGRAALVAMVLAAAPGVACSSGGGHAAATTVPRPSTGAGAPIVAGLVVESGSELLGVAFPESVPAGRDQPWTAVVLVNGDGSSVYNAYVAQLQRHGIALRRSACSYVNGRNVFGGPAPPRSTQHGFPILCSTRGRPVPAAAGPITAVDLRLWTKGHDRGSSWASHIVLTVTTRRNAGRPPLPVPPSAAAELPAHKLPDPGPAPSPPKVATTIPPTNIDPGLPLALRKGTSLLAPAIPRGLEQSWTAVLRLAGDPAKHVRGYLKADPLVARDPGVKLSTVTTEIAGRKVMYGSWSVPGGIDLRLTARPDAAGTWYLLMEAGTG